MIKFSTKKTLEGWAATFTIGVQTFQLLDVESKKHAEWYVICLQAAFKNLTGQEYGIKTIEDQHSKPVISRVRLPFSDGSFTFYTIQPNGLYKNEQGSEITIDEVLKLLGASRVVKIGDGRVVIDGETYVSENSKRVLPMKKFIELHEEGKPKRKQKKK